MGRMENEILDEIRHSRNALYGPYKIPKEKERPRSTVKLRDHLKCRESSGKTEEPCREPEA